MDISGFEERMDQLVEQGRTSKHTKSTYVLAVRRFAEWWGGDDDEEPTPQDVKEYADHLAETGKDNSGIQTVYYGLKRYFKYQDREPALAQSGVDDYISTHYPSGGEDTPDYLEDDEVDALREAAHDDPRDAAIIYLLASTGMRVGELVELDVDDLDLDVPEVFVERQKRKEDVMEAVPLSDNDVTILKKYLEMREEYGPADESDALILTRNGRMSVDTVQRRVKLVAERAEGVDPDDVTPHKLRHWVGTKLAAQGRGAPEIARYLGHASTNTANKYIHLSSEHLRDMREDLNA